MFELLDCLGCSPRDDTGLDSEFIESFATV